MSLKLQAVFVSARPKQWVKNFFVLAALVFAKEFTNPQAISSAAAAFLLFCLASSGVYMINDVLDLATDRDHPTKRFRPLPAGQISAPALAWSGVLSLAAAAAGSFFIRQSFTLALLSFMAINVLYSFWLKRIIFVDVMIVGLGFVLRVAAGALAINVPFSAWLLLCTFFLTLFLAIGKRKSDILLVGAKTAPVYSAAMLDQMNAVVMPSTLIAYSFYTFNSPHSQWLMISIPFVIYGLFRSLFINNTKTAPNNGPSDDLFSDGPLQLTLLLWLLTAVTILIYG